MDRISNACDELKLENTKLKEQNDTLFNKVAALESRLDNVEGQSRRNNLIFRGIEWRSNDSWEVCEQKIRSFVSDTLGLPAGDADLGIERVHRLRGRDNGDPVP